MNVCLTGIGWVNSGGFGMGKSGNFQPGPGELPEIKRKDVFAALYQRFGRLDPFSKIGLTGITFAIRDAGLEAWTEKRPIGLIAATDYGCLQTDLDYFETVIPDGGQLASPNLFAYTLPNCFLGEAAIRFGLTGGNYVINASSGLDLACLQMGLENIAWGEAKQLLIGINNPPLPGEIMTEAGRSTGSLFIVLENERPEARDTYGEVALIADKILFEGRTITSLEGLVTCALAKA